MIQNKKFQNIENQEVVTVVGESGMFYSLSNGSNIKKDIFFQKYSETVDAGSFFREQTAAGLSNLAEQLKTVDSSKIVDGKIPPKVKYVQKAISEQVTAPPEYREMLLRKFEAEQANKDLSQYRVYEDDDEAAADFERKMAQKVQQKRENRPQMEQQPEPQMAEQYEPTNIREAQQTQNYTPNYVDPEEESFRFFKSFKRIHQIKLAVEFDEKIAEPQFIRMMVNNFEGDIIKFYTKEIMNRIYNDPGYLENKIYDKLRKTIFEEDDEKPVRKPRVPRKKPTTTTTTRKKKETTSNG